MSFLLEILRIDSVLSSPDKYAKASFLEIAILALKLFRSFINKLPIYLGE